MVELQHDLSPSLGADAFFDAPGDGDEPLEACMLHVRVCSSYLEESLHVVVNQAPAVCTLSGKPPLGRLSPGWDPATVPPLSGTKNVATSSRFITSGSMPISGLCEGDPSAPYGCISGDSAQCRPCRRLERAARRVWLESVVIIRRNFRQAGVKEIYARGRDTVKAWVAAGYAISVGDGGGLVRLAPTFEAVVSGLVSRDGPSGVGFFAILPSSRVIGNERRRHGDDDIPLGYPVGPSVWGAAIHPLRRHDPGLVALVASGILTPRAWLLPPAFGDPGPSGSDPLPSTPSA